jgi:hypothetical protein
MICINNSAVVASILCLQMMKVFNSDTPVWQGRYLGDINSDSIDLHKVPLKQIGRKCNNNTILLSLKGLEFES